MNLYEIDSNLQAAFEAAFDPETGEILDEKMAEEFDQLQIDRDTKIENICLFIKNLKSDAAALKAEKESFAARQKATEKRAESLCRYLDGYLNGQKFKTARASVSYRKSEAVDVTDMAKVPEIYLSYGEPTANKSEIKAAIKRGEEVPGAELVEKSNMIIK